jgi:hypothetical protein
MIVTYETTKTIQITQDTRYNQFSFYAETEDHTESYKLSKKSFNRLMKQLKAKYTPKFAGTEKSDYKLYFFNVPVKITKHVSEDF